MPRGGTEAVNSTTAQSSQVTNLAGATMVRLANHDARLQALEVRVAHLEEPVTRAEPTDLPPPPAYESDPPPPYEAPVRPPAEVLHESFNVINVEAIDLDYQILLRKKVRDFEIDTYPDLMLTLSMPMKRCVLNFMIRNPNRFQENVALDELDVSYLAFHAHNITENGLIKYLRNHCSHLFVVGQGDIYVLQRFVRFLTNDENFTTYQNNPIKYRFEKQVRQKLAEHFNDDIARAQRMREEATVLGPIAIIPPARRHW